MFTQLQISSVLSLSLLSSSDLQVWVMSKKDPVEWVDSMIFLIKRPLTSLVILKSDSMMLLAWIKANFKLESLLIFLKIHKSIKNQVLEFQKEFYCQDLLEQVKHYQEKLVQVKPVFLSFRLRVQTLLKFLSELVLQESEIYLPQQDKKRHQLFLSTKSMPLVVNVVVHMDLMMKETTH